MAIGFLKRNNFLLKKFSDNGTWTKGEYTPPSFSGSCIYGDIQPINRRELRDLPEGTRIDDAIKVFSKTKLDIKDVVTWGTRTFRIEMVNDWHETSTPHYEAIAIAIDSNSTDRSS